MSQSAVSIMKTEEEIKLNVIGEFDGLQTVEVVDDLMNPSNGVDRIALDLSRASKIKPIEMYYLLAELSMDPRFSATEISVEGLRCQGAHGRR